MITGQSYRMTYKGGKLSKVSFDGMETTCFYTNGFIKKYVYNDKSDPSTKITEEYDKHGNLTYSSDSFATYRYKNTYKNGDLVRCVAEKKKKSKYVAYSTTEITNTYDEAGRIVKVRNEIRYEGEPYKTVCTLSYTYNKKGAVTKAVWNRKEVYDDGSVIKEPKSITVFTYKNVEVAKKYRKFVDDRMELLNPNEPSKYLPERRPYGLTLEISTPVIVRIY